MNKLGKSLTKAETIELQYFYLSGCRYITKGGFNYTSVWRVKPTLQKKHSFDVWRDECDIHPEGEFAKFGMYESITLDDGPILISDLVDISELNA